MLVRTVAISSGARWQDGKMARPWIFERFEWRELKAAGAKDLGAAVQLVNEELKADRLGTRGYPPLLILILDGPPTDDCRSALLELLQSPWGKRAVGIAIAIGRHCDHDPLRELIANVDSPVLEADNAQTCVKYMRWIPQEVARAASMPSSSVERCTDFPAGPGPKFPKPGVLPGVDEPDVW